MSMRLRIATPVEQEFRRVFAAFDASLFARLSPPFPRLRVVRFDGCHDGDVYELELDFLVFRQRWRGRVTEVGSDERSCWFVDEGEALPFFLTRWTHRHIVRQAGDGAVIIDDVEYAGPGRLATWLMYPVMWLQFAYRRPIYRRTFAPTA